MRHLKCATFTLIGRIGEKLFGLGRKKSIDLAHRNHVNLVCQVNNSFGRITGQLIGCRVLLEFKMTLYKRQLEE